MKTWDTVVVGGGIIGFSLALELRKHGASVLLVERSQPGRESSHAAAGMLANCGDETPAAVQPLADASARLYPEFVHQLQDESGIDVGLRDQGTILFLQPDEVVPSDGQELPSAEVKRLEPHLRTDGHRAVFLRERSVDNRAVMAALVKAAQHRGIDLATGTPVTGLELQTGRAVAATTSKTHYPAATIVNCAGAWAGQIDPVPFPTRPVKGQMLAVIPAQRELIRHVIRHPSVYLVPRSDGRLLIGATLEEAGFDKRVVPETIQRMHHAALELVPDLSQARVLEDWAGLRPGTPDDLPILGVTSIPGYFTACGHYRDGILLAPVTARLMAQVILGKAPDIDLAPFSPARFATARLASTEVRP